MFKSIILALTIILGQSQVPNTSQVTTKKALAVQETVDISQEARIINSYDQKQIRCLAENTYHEARGEPRAGQIAVLNVVMNRVDDSRFPTNPCGVIYQRNRNGCQFSWVCHGTKGIRNHVAFAHIREIAEDVYFNNLKDNTRGAAFYHARYVKPSWSYKMSRTIQIGDHIFYKG